MVEKKENDLKKEAIVKQVSELINHNLNLDAFLAWESTEKRNERWHDGLKSLIEAIETLMS